MVSLHLVVAIWDLQGFSQKTHCSVFLQIIRAQLGKPEKLYEQTIRSLLVYMQLFSMVVVDPEVTKHRLLQYLTTKFQYESLTLVLFCTSPSGCISNMRSLFLEISLSLVQDPCILFILDLSSLYLFTLISVHKE